MRHGNSTFSVTRPGRVPSIPEPTPATAHRTGRAQGTLRRDGVEKSAEGLSASGIPAAPAAARRYCRAQAAESWGVRRTYVPRQPERTVLHQVVREHLETFLAEARHRGGEGCHGLS